MKPAVPREETGHSSKPGALAALSCQLLCSPRITPCPQSVKPRHKRHMHRVTLEDLPEARMPHPMTVDDLFEQGGKLRNSLLGRRLKEMPPRCLSNDASAPKIASDGHGNGPVEELTAHRQGRFDPCFCSWAETTRRSSEVNP